MSHIYWVSMTHQHRSYIDNSLTLSWFSNSKNGSIIALQSFWFSSGHVVGSLIWSGTASMLFDLFRVKFLKKHTWYPLKIWTIHWNLFPYYSLGILIFNFELCAPMLYDWWAIILLLSVRPELRSKSLRTVGPDIVPKTGRSFSLFSSWLKCFFNSENARF